MKGQQVGGGTISIYPEQGIEARYSQYKDLVARSVEVLGSDLQATRWLSGSIEAFGGRTPLQVFAQDGPEPVCEVLGRLEHGVFA